MRIAIYRHNTLLNYLSVLKPRETSLLTFIGICSAIIAANGYLSIDILILTIITLGFGSAGCNGLTNYLDREVDAKMTRTRYRVLPSKQIYPPQKVLPLIMGLIISALILAWVLNPLCFLFGIVGVASSILWRKTMSCTFFGVIAGCSPVLIGWCAGNPIFNINILLICLLIAFWIPIHVWSVMLNKREEYLAADLVYFPLNLKVKGVLRILFVLSILLYLISLFLYLSADLHLLYLIIVNIFGVLMIYYSARLLISATQTGSWRIYKLSTFPYLGIIFLTICLDIWMM